MKAKGEEGVNEYLVGVTLDIRVREKLRVVFAYENFEAQHESKVDPTADRSRTGEQGQEIKGRTIPGQRNQTCGEHSPRPHCGL